MTYRDYIHASLKSASSSGHNNVYENKFIIKIHIHMQS